MLKKNLFIILALGLLFPSCNSNISETVWSDEFNYQGIPDDGKWTLVKGDGCPELCGFGNNEKQVYTSDPDNVYVKDGKLVITAHYDENQSAPYTSAKLVSKHKGDWKYGTVEIKAKVPRGRGTWSAIWMLPTLNRNNRWPLDGEIDIMEHVGFHPGWVHGAVHTKSYNGMHKTQKVDSIFVENSFEDFHIYKVDWDEERIEWSVDDEVYHVYKKEEVETDDWPFDKEFHLIMNIAIGGDWGGRHGIDNEVMPQQMEVDYIRVHKKLD